MTQKSATTTEPPIFISGWCGDGKADWSHERCLGDFLPDPKYPKNPTRCNCSCHTVRTWTVAYVNEGLELEEPAWQTLVDARHFARYLDDMGLGIQIEVIEVGARKPRLT